MAEILAKTTGGNDIYPRVASYGSGLTPQRLAAAFLDDLLKDPKSGHGATLAHAYAARFALEASKA